MDKIGLLALVGGSEWTEGCTFDAGLLAASGGNEVVVLPTAAAYQHPERVVLEAAEWFEPLGGQVEGLMVLDRASANDPGMAAVVRAARFLYLAGGSPLHLKSVLKGSATFEALREAWSGGRRRGRLRRRRHGAHRPDGRSAGRCADAWDSAWSTSWPSCPISATGPTTSTARSWSARWPSLPTGYPWWASRSAPRSSGTATGRGATRASAPPVVFLNGARTAGLGALQR